MLRSLRRKASIYGAIAANVPKVMMAYSIWFWVDILGQILMMTIFVFFWRAVYANTATVGGLTASQTISYILFAQIFGSLVRSNFVLQMGGLVGQGMVAIEMLRPVDMQARYYTEMLTFTVVSFIRQCIPMSLVAWLLFGLQIPTDPTIWLTFVVSLLLGHAVLFCFEWTFATLAFVTTETWGLHVLREGIAAFFSGALIPLAMLPGWLKSIANLLPFGQSLYVPVALLTGMLPPGAAPRALLGQVLWLAGMLVVSRLTFSVAVRKVTVQGG